MYGHFNCLKNSFVLAKNLDLFIKCSVEFIVIICVCIALLIGFLLRSPKWQRPQSTQADNRTLHAYEARPSLFVNSSERAFFKALLKNKPAQYHVFAKVRLEDILRVRSDIKNEQARWHYRGRVKSRHPAFVVCDTSGHFICAIELDGSANRGEEAAMVDSFKDEIFRNAGLTLYRARTGVDFAIYTRKLWENITHSLGSNGRNK